MATLPATYQFSSATAGVKGGLFETQGLTSLSTLGTTPWRRATMQGMGGRGGYSTFADRALIQALAGSLAGGVASGSRRRVAPTEELGGLRPIEVYVAVSRNTVAGDITEYQNEWFNRMHSRTHFLGGTVNLDRNPLGTR